MNTFKNEQYTITTSLSDHSIYIKIVNNVSYATYEGTFEKPAFRLSFELAGIYRLINKCFAAFTDGGDNKYSVAAELEPSVVRLAFHCAIEEFIELDFEIRLKEKVVSGDSVVSMELEKQKQIIEMLNEKVEKQAADFTDLHRKYSESMRMFIDQQANMAAELTKLTDKLKLLETADRENRLKIQKHEQLIEQLGFAEICFTHNGFVRWSFPISSKVIEFRNPFECITVDAESLKKIKYFYQLEELVIPHSISIDTQYLSNATVKKVKILINGTNNEDMSFIIKGFPNLVDLSIMGSTLINQSHLISLLNNNIKKLTIFNLPNNNLTQLKVYCKENGIELYFMDLSGQF